MNSLKLRDAITSSPFWSSTRCEEILGEYSSTKTDVQKNRASRVLLEKLATEAGIDPGSDEAVAVMEEGAKNVDSMAGALKALEALQKQIKDAMTPKAAPAVSGAPDTVTLAKVKELENTVIDLGGKIGTFETQVANVAKCSKESDEKIVTELRDCLTKAVEHHTEKTDNTLKEIRDLVNTSLSAPAPVRARVAAAVSAGKGGLTPAETVLAKYLPPAANVNANAVLLIGGSGTGKSWGAERHGRAFDYAPAPFGCTPATEAWELFGCVTQTEAGLNYVDGYLSECFRQANDGKSVCIVLDELPRLADNVKQALLTLLTPRNGTGKFAGELVFALRSGRALELKPGQWIFESLEAPVTHVAFVATGNIGDAYGVPSGSIDEAVFKRFAHARINWDPSTAERIFEAELAGGKMPKAWAAPLVQFIQESRIMQESANDLAYPACVRTIVRAIRNSTDAPTLKAELNTLATETLACWERGGETSEQSVAAIKTKLQPIMDKISK